MNVFPIGVDFTPSPNMTPADVPTLDFNMNPGLWTVNQSLIQYGRDPVTNDEVISFSFGSSVGDRQKVELSDNPLPRTVTGYAMKAADNSVVVGAQKLPAPITYTVVNQIVEWGNVSFRYPVSAVR